MSDGDDQAAGDEVTCVGCRQTGDRVDLERFVYHDRTGVMYDMRRGAPGDEAWVHPLVGCLRAACWAGFSRAFETPLEDLDVTEIYESVDTGLHRRLRERLSDAARLDELAVGVSAVRELADAGDLELVLVDPEFDGLSEETTGGAVRFDDMRSGTLSEAFGRRVEAVGVPSGPREAEFGRLAEKLVCLHSDEPEDG